MKLPRNELNGWIVASVPAPDGGRHGWTPCMDWCRRTFGTAPTTNLLWGNNWRYVSEGVFEFRRADDHVMFLLKWA